MERTIHKAKRVNLSSPAFPKPSKKKCFGNLWNPTHEICEKCPATFQCLNSYRQHIKAKVDKFEASENFVDKIEFSLYDWSGLHNLIKQRGKVAVSKTLPSIMEAAKCDVELLAMIKLKGWCIENNLRITEKWISLN